VGIGEFRVAESSPSKGIPLAANFLNDSSAASS